MLHVEGGMMISKQFLIQDFVIDMRDEYSRSLYNDTMMFLFE